MRVVILILSGLIATCSAALSGPFLFWGQENVVNLQPRALVEASEEDFVNLFQQAKSVVVFVRNNSNTRLDSNNYPEFQKLIKSNAWAYLPQRSLVVEPFNYNSNVEIINLSGVAQEEDAHLISAYNEAIAIYGQGKVLAILAHWQDESVQHFLSKREAKSEEEDSKSTTIPTPTAASSESEESEEGFIYLVEEKAILYVNSAPLLTINKEEIKLNEHRKLTFDDQKSKGFGRLNLIFSVDKEKLFLRFNFTYIQDSWSMKSVEVEFKDLKTILPIVGTTYNVPSAPVGFSYRCSTRKMLFNNGNDTTLELNDYQVQPWLNGAKKFGDVYDCVGFTTAPIWAGILVSLLLCGILSIGLLAVMDIKTPNRFETSRNKQLTFTVQE